MAKNNINSPTNKAKQKEGLAKFHANPDKPTSAGSIKTPRALSDMNRKLKEMLDPAIENIRKVVSPQAGEAEVTKQQADMSKWIVQTVVNNEKAAIADKMQRLELKAKLEIAKQNGLIEKDDPQEEARKLAAEGNHIRRINLDYDPSWDEEEDDND